MPHKFAAHGLCHFKTAFRHGKICGGRETERQERAFLLHKNCSNSNRAFKTEGPVRLHLDSAKKAPADRERHEKCPFASSATAPLNSCATFVSSSSLRAIFTATFCHKRSRRKGEKRGPRPKRALVNGKLALRLAVVL